MGSPLVRQQDVLSTGLEPLLLEVGVARVESFHGPLLPLEQLDPLVLLPLHELVPLLPPDFLPLHLEQFLLEFAALGPLPLQHDLVLLDLPLQADDLILVVLYRVLLLVRPGDQALVLHLQRLDGLLVHFVPRPLLGVRERARVPQQALHVEVRPAQAVVVVLLQAEHLDLQVPDVLDLLHVLLLQVLVLLLQLLPVEDGVLPEPLDDVVDFGLLGHDMVVLLREDVDEEKNNLYLILDLVDIFFAELKLEELHELLDLLLQLLHLLGPFEVQQLLQVLYLQVRLADLIDQGVRDRVQPPIAFQLFSQEPHLYQTLVMFLSVVGQLLGYLAQFLVGVRGIGVEGGVGLLVVIQGQTLGDHARLDELAVESSPGHDGLAQVVDNDLLAGPVLPLVHCAHPLFPSLFNIITGLIILMEVGEREVKLGQARADRWVEYKKISYIIKVVSIKFLFQMLKKPGNISTSLSPIDSLKFSTFNYFGMGAVLASVAESFWINFSAYYLNNILPSYGNLIFLAAQVSEGVGIILGWFILAKLGSKFKIRNQDKIEPEGKHCNGGCLEGINLYMLVYILGALLLIVCLPLVFFLPLTSPGAVLGFSIVAKIGSGLMIISQITIIPKITLNRSRRRKLVQKVTQYGLAGTFVSMLVMTVVSEYANFIWKYFFGVCGFVLVGGLCSMVYVYKIRQLVMSHAESTSKENIRQSSSSAQGKQKQESPEGIVQCSLLRSPKFYLYAIVLIFCTLYMDIVIAIYPYFIKSFRNISHLRYLSAITALYLSSFVSSLLTKNAFVFSSIRSIMTVGFVCCVLATVLLVIGLIDREFDTLMVVGTCLTGVAKVIAMNCALNVINQFVGKEIKGREFVYGFYYFIEKLVTGFVLFALIRKVYLTEDVEFLHFSEIYLPFILYSLAWVLIMVDRTLTEKVSKASHIVIVQPNKAKTPSSEPQAQGKLKKPNFMEVNEQICPKLQAKYKNWVQRELQVPA